MATLLAGAGKIKNEAFLKLKPEEQRAVVRNQIADCIALDKSLTKSFLKCMEAYTVCLENYGMLEEETKKQETYKNTADTFLQRLNFLRNVFDNHFVVGEAPTAPDFDGHSGLETKAAGVLYAAKGGLQQFDSKHKVTEKTQKSLEKAKDKTVKETKKAWKQFNKWWGGSDEENNKKNDDANSSMAPMKGGIDGSDPNFWAAEELDAQARARATANAAQGSGPPPPPPPAPPGSAPTTAPAPGAGATTTTTQQNFEDLLGFDNPPAPPAKPKPVNFDDDFADFGQAPPAAGTATGTAWPQEDSGATFATGAAVNESMPTDGDEAFGTPNATTPNAAQSPDGTFGIE